MLLSDRDILAAQADGYISLDPWTPEMVQPASIDVRLDRFFRLFRGKRYSPAFFHDCICKTGSGIKKGLSAFHFAYPPCSFYPDK